MKRLLLIFLILFSNSLFAKEMITIHRDGMKAYESPESEKYYPTIKGNFNFLYEINGWLCYKGTVGDSVFLYDPHGVYSSIYIVDNSFQSKISNVSLLGIIPSKKVIVFSGILLCIIWWIWRNREDGYGDDASDAFNICTIIFCTLICAGAIFFFILVGNNYINNWLFYNKYTFDLSLGLMLVWNGIVQIWYIILFLILAVSLLVMLIAINSYVRDNIYSSDIDDRRIEIFGAISLIASLVFPIALSCITSISKAEIDVATIPEMFSRFFAVFTTENVSTANIWYSILFFIYLALISITFVFILKNLKENRFLILLLFILFITATSIVFIATFFSMNALVYKHFHIGLIFTGLAFILLMGAGSSQTSGSYSTQPSGSTSSSSLGTNDPSRNCIQCHHYLGGECTHWIAKDRYRPIQRGCPFFDE